ncbi:4a-hydroxytetrahydrobiopterin dehydratase [Planctomicrobium sp. SH664]|uniref:4a-hydroxytetrahydrobiopterin dehydratase n=1 Tax=Planctomicrobium sp. SH664 TaxID=3448125 RepID=UPI003F5C8118
MTITSEQLRSKKCLPCEGGVEKLSREVSEQLLASVPGWQLSDDHSSIARSWTVRNFVAGMEFLNRIAEVAEAEQHHPDLHLTGYRKVRVELSTHAIGGLSENDFIIAAKINDIPVAEKSAR